MTEKSIHEEYQYIGGNRDAIVFVHGILGSPAQFRFFAEELHRQGHDCMALLLPGHGGSSGAFCKASGKQWQQYANEYVDRVKEKHEHVFLMGHSLGGLLSLNYAVYRKISGIVLLNTSLTFRIGLKQLLFSAKIMLSNPGRDDDFLSTYRQAFSITSGRFYEYPFWIRQFASLFNIARKTRRMLGDIDIPVLIVQAAKDESVGKRSAGMLKSGLVNASAEIMELKESYHGYLTEGDKQRLLNAVERFVESA